VIHAESGGISFQIQGPETVMCTVFVMNVIGIDGSGECSQRQVVLVVSCVCLSVCLRFRRRRVSRVFLS